MRMRDKDAHDSLTVLRQIRIVINDFQDTKLVRLRILAAGFNQKDVLIDLNDI